jgi:hypothetical protein
MKITIYGWSTNPGVNARACAQEGGQVMEKGEVSTVALDVRDPTELVVQPSLAYERAERIVDGLDGVGRANGPTDLGVEPS